MQGLLSKALSSLVEKHISLSSSRRETLVWLVGAMLAAGTTSLWRLARFFQHVRFDGAAHARLIVSMLGLERSGRWDLALDRTNLKLGKVHINILMLGLMWRGVCVPLLWTLLPKAGNSKTEARITLIKRLVRTFPDQKLEQIPKRWNHLRFHL